MFHEAVSIQRTAKWAEGRKFLWDKNKKEKNGKYLIGREITWPALIGVRRNTEVSIESRDALGLGDWLSGYTAFLAEQSLYGGTKPSKFEFADTAHQAGTLHLYPRYLFQH